MKKKRIILAGGSGFIGRTLSSALREQGCDVIVLSRNPQKRTDGVTELTWDGEIAGPWVSALEGAEAIVNLAGRNINCPHTPENLAEITASRVRSVQAIAQALPLLTQAPRVWVQASAIGIYGDTGDNTCDESSPAGTGTLAKICRDWENAFLAVPLTNTRPVILRIGFVLGREGGALPVLSKLTRMFMGGSAGSGRQYISWIHQADLTRMFVAAIEEDLSGIYNAVAPNPVTNAAFMKSLRHALHRPWSPPAPEFAVRLGSRLMNSEPALALTSTRCVPRRLQERGFMFEFGDLDGALQNLCS